MNSSSNTTLQDKTTLAGLALLAISFFVFVATKNVYNTDFDLFSNIFFFNYGLTFFYASVLLFKNKRETGRYFKFSNFARNIILLQLFNLSAYSLNRAIPVFNISTDWVVVFLLISNSLLLIHALRRNFTSNWFNHLVVVASNIAILFHFYESIYVFQAYPFGFIFFWLFGFSLHIFVPILFTIAYIKVARKFLKKSPTFWATTLLSWVFVFGLLTYTSIRFNHINTTVNETFHHTNKPYETQSLPAWVATSQLLKKDWITERALKTRLVYTSAENVFDSFGSMRINERIKHDPLVVIASFFSAGIDIQADQKVKILRYMFDARHQTERKFWNGDNLSTSDIITNVQLFPQYRLAYTEKTFKIKNSQVGRWRNQQEALYTFHIPEGSVVTSAALWINGKEEPAYLTTKEKADSAYTSIVGYERRDPLLLHWQEGNRVTVRVFPCTPDEDRQFKIGVTTPLQKSGHQLKYENIDFEGPYWQLAKESINIVSEGALKNISTPFSFKENGTNYTYMGRYRSDWSLAFDALPIAQQAFSFNGKSFSLQDHQKKEVTFDASEIYLDINAGWTKNELAEIWKYVQTKKVFVWSNNKMEKVTESNKQALWKQMRSQNFTLFPFYKIAQAQQALVISKFNQMTPTLSDLGNCFFINEMSNFFQQQQQQAIRLYNLGQEISPYLKALQEMRSIQLESGTVHDLSELLKNKSFLQNQENDHTIVNRYGGFQIKTTPNENSVASNAPDHLMRLFAYNDVLRAVGKNYFNKKELANDLIETAKEAYVVTPISSLIVLETQKDYDRFNIQKSKNSLQNASIGNSGAVPEPHEWLLIILVLGMTLYFYFRR